ncbi:MAG TPA: phage tail protein [Polyangiaceae bacterium]|nr:phage tail protein [Polyangiaceae bacterium]
MANPRPTPYSQFNFTVGFANIDDGPFGGFQECSNLGQEVTVAEYRNGNDAMNHVRKVTGLNKAADVTLKRGVVGTLPFYTWMDSIRRGSVDTISGAVQDVTIILNTEDQQAPVFTWTLHNARITKHVCGPLNAKGTDVAMEEITLAYEWLEMS